MKLLYGVQATGNGHITRARAMAPKLKAAGIEVDFLFSGRPEDQLFDMEPFGDYQCRTGMTFVSREGRLDTLATLLNCHPHRLWRDAKALPFHDYDLVLTDYEPVTAWGARQAGVDAIGLGHQYAFRHNVPQHRGSLTQQLVMRNFAPVNRWLGLHWYHFGAPVLPPIAPVEKPAEARVEENGQDLSVTAKAVIIVYLPFESIAAIEALLQPQSPTSFVAYHPLAPAVAGGNIRWHKPCRHGFQRDLRYCNGVICNAGFELASEVLQLGKKLLVKPMGGQPEQASNALALKQLGFGAVMQQLDSNVVANWLEQQSPQPIVYPDVAAAICQWLVSGCDRDVDVLARELWQQTRFPVDFSGHPGDSPCPNL